MFYVNDERPWHGLGTPVDNALTAVEAIAVAHLGWTVEKRQVFFKMEDGTYRAADGYATVRTDIERPLGLVSSSYKPIQNHEAFSFMDVLVGSGEAKHITAGALFSGEKVWMLCRLPGKLTVRGDDTVGKYLLLCKHHNGKGGCKVLITPIRVVYNNTLRIALSGADGAVNIHHTGNIQHKVSEAQRILGISLDYFGVLEETFRAFAHREMTAREIAAYVTEVIRGDSFFAERARSRVMDLHETGIGSEMAEGTLWGAYNAVVEYVDHNRIDKRKEDRYIESNTFGRGADIKTKAYEAAPAIVRN